MGLFSKKPAPAVVQSFDGVAGRHQLGSLLDAYLQRVEEGNIDAAGDVVQAIVRAKPGDPNARVGPDFFTAPWTWMAAVAEQAERDGEIKLCGQIGVFTAVWIDIIDDDPRFAMGRLVEAPIATEQRIYRAALRSLIQLTPDAAMSRGSDPFRASVSVELIMRRVDQLERKGETIDLELRSALSSGVQFGGEMAPPQNESDRSSEIVDRGVTALREEMANVEAGDEASRTYLEGCALIIQGGSEEDAASLFERAARLGHVPAMFDAGNSARDRNDLPTAHFWWSQAADGGNADAAWNMGASLATNGEPRQGMRYFERAAELGNIDAYAALTQIADELGDSAAEQQWQRRGADAGQPFCEFRHGLHLAMNANDEEDVLRTARDYFEHAASQGHGPSMSMAANMNSMLGEHARARGYVTMVIESGDQEQIAMLKKHGFI